MPQDLCIALRASRLSRLSLHFGGGCEQTLDGDLALGALAPNLPTTLTKSSLFFNGFGKLTDAGLECLGARLPELTLLRDLELSFEYCRDISDFGFTLMADRIASL